MARREEPGCTPLSMALHRALHSPVLCQVLPERENVLTNFSFPCYVSVHFVHMWWGLVGPVKQKGLLKIYPLND